MFKNLFLLRLQAGQQEILPFRRIAINYSLKTNLVEYKNIFICSFLSREIIIKLIKSYKISRVDDFILLPLYMMVTLERRESEELKKYKIMQKGHTRQQRPRVKIKMFM